MVKYSLTVIAATMALAVFSTLSLAEPDPNDVMAKLQKMQDCMSTIDMTQIQALEKRAKKLQAEVEAFCSAGELKQARQKAMDFGNEIAASETVKQVAKCTEIMKGMIPELSLADFEQDFSTINICDASL